MVNAKCFFHPQDIELKFRYSMCFILQNYKNCGIFLEARCNSKIKLIKTKCIVMALLWKQWFLWAKVKVSCLKMLETIVTEATFFSIWVFFLEHSQFTGQQGKGEAISLTLCRGDKTFWANNLWTGYSKWKD